MVNKKSLLKIIGSVVILGAALVSSLKAKEEVIERPKKSSTAKTIYNNKEKVDLYYEDGKTVREDIDLQLDVDNKNNSIDLELRTQNFNNPDWKEEAIQFKKPTPINTRWSEIYLMHPQEVIAKTEIQSGYTVPKHQWIKLIPAEEDKTTQIVAKHGQELINETVKISIPFPDADKALESFMDKKKTEKSSLLKKLESLAKEGYSVTRIPENVQRNISSNLTARHYKINIDMDNVDNETSPEMYLWVKTTLGDPSIAPDGSVQNRSGTHNQVIPFTLTGKKGVPKGDVEVYHKKSEEENLDIYIKVNGVEKRLTTSPNPDLYPVLSPNKKKIVFNSGNANQWARYVINTDGTELELIGHIRDYHETPTWSEDSRGFIISQQCSAASDYGTVVYYQDYFFDLKLKRTTEQVGGKKWDYDAQQVVPFDETHEERIKRRRKLLENAKATGKKIPQAWQAYDFLK